MRAERERERGILSRSDIEDPCYLIIKLETSHGRLILPGHPFHVSLAIFLRMRSVPGHSGRWVDIRSFFSYSLNNPVSKLDDNAIEVFFF